MQPASISLLALHSLCREGSRDDPSVPGADLIQLPDVDLRTPLDHFRILRAIWACTTQSEVDSKYKKFICHPFGKTFQPSQAIVYLLGKQSVPLIPVLSEQGEAQLETGSFWLEGQIPRLPELCQLALLWSLTGHREESLRLTRWLLPLLEHPTLWSQERQWDEREFLCSAALFYSYAGKEEKARGCFEKLKKKGPLEIDPFFLKLEKEISPCIGLVDFEPLSDSWVLTELGIGTSLGGAKKGAIEIRAFGPQSYPLTDAKGFGIYSQTKEERGWVCCQADRTLWLSYALSSCVNLKRSEDQGLGSQNLTARSLDIRMIGLRGEMKIAFVFYLKAESCAIGSTVFKPKNLKRYQGLEEKIRFAAQGEQLEFCFSEPKKIELIPLAGQGCFWNADFLLAVEMNFSMPKISMEIRG